MTTFTVTGHRGQTITQLTWTDGEISGDAQAADMVKWLATAHEGQYVSCPPAAGTDHDHLQDAWSSFALMHLVFSDTPRLTAGALPEIEAPPPNTVI